MKLSNKASIHNISALLTGWRGGFSQTLNNKVENLKLQSTDLSLSPQSMNMQSLVNLGLVTPERLKNYILSKKTIKLESNTNYNVESKLNKNEKILKLSELLTGGAAPAEVINLKAMPNGNIGVHVMESDRIEGAECQYVPIGDSHMSLTLFKNYLNNSSLLKGGKNRKNPLIRHYLNLLTKFDFNLANSKYDFYQFKKSNKILFAMEKAADFLKLAFLAKGCLISRPTFNIVYTLNRLESISEGLNTNKYGNLMYSNKAKIIIHLFYYVKNNSKSVSASLTEGTDGKNISSVYNEKLSFLIDYLTKLFNTEVELNLVRLYQPYQDSSILVQHLNSESYNSKFIKLVSRLFRRINIYKKIKFSKGNINMPNGHAAYPSGISGVNIKLAGRPINEKIIPRLTVKRAQRGNFNRLNSKVIEKSMFTDKSRKGAFNFTVRLSHIFR
uniref:Small ribosomal subunit protein uS3m n=1 Tax=Coniferiporia sulphurascens TaxID=175648 RepID=A0A5B9R9Q6_CONSH|nr:ribosomal protein S3 [Coniferiporia sulphurascens]QEG57168.1 ribosomal protein S3 [Coniferiporia sulphurascens]